MSRSGSGSSGSLAALPETQVKINVLSFGTIQNDATLNDVVANLSDELQLLTSQLLRQQETNEHQQYIIARQAERIDVLTERVTLLEADTADGASQENGTKTHLHTTPLSSYSGHVSLALLT